MRLLLIFTLLWLSSCAKVSYVTGQGISQLALEWNGQDNQQVLKDPKVKDLHKEKIKKIIQYKDFFYKYFKYKPTPIYDETTFLKDEAVTYLVIASKSTEISPLMTSFPFVGSFPYLGFFDKQKAIQYQKELERENYVTYMRPVYAYTTLNKLPFYDNILSSFFIYDDHHLAELIFHELVHTIFFVKDEVDFNEALADYIATRMTYEYFNYNESEKQKWLKHDQAEERLMQIIVKSARKLNSLYQSQRDLTKESALTIMEAFNKTDFLPSIEAFCRNQKMDRCWPLKTKWNNATFAAFMTYQKEQNLVEVIHSKYNFSLKDLLTYFEMSYKDYKSGDMNSFVNYLKKKEQL